MTTYIIAVRNPTTKRLIIISKDSANGESEGPLEFTAEDAAVTMAVGVSICKAWGFEIVPISLDA
jgi:3-hydroxy-3-methylglutaryl CoA synthase